MTTPNKSTESLSADELEERCLCAAIEVDAGGSPIVIVGGRHHEIISGLNFNHVQWRDCNRQGFLTTKGRFVTRREGLLLQLRNGIPSARGHYHPTELFSEDLY